MIFEKAGNPVTEINWTPPTQREDGSPYEAQDHLGYELGFSDPNDPNDGFLPHISFPTSLGTTSWQLNDLNITTEGNFEVALRTIDIGDKKSIWSNPSVFTAGQASPNPPTGFNVF